jgi:four helix bundle protein
VVFQVSRNDELGMMNDERRGANMQQTPDILSRTRDFSLRVIRLYSDLPGGTLAQCLGKQVLRSGTSVGAQLREGKRSRSISEMISKTESALQELEESIYWLELLGASGVINPPRLVPLTQEADQLTAILVSCVKSLKMRKPVRG